MSELILSLQNTQIYQRENLVLSNVNMQINKGEFVYLIGKTGSLIVAASEGHCF